MNTETDGYIDNGSQGTGMRREKYMEVKCAVNSRAVSVHSYRSMDLTTFNPSC